jgi:hypothetical protein
MKFKASRKPCRQNMVCFAFFRRRAASVAAPETPAINMRKPTRVLMLEGFCPAHDLRSTKRVAAKSVPTAQNKAAVFLRQHARQYGLYHDAPIHGLRQGLVLIRVACEPTTAWTEFEVF